MATADTIPAPPPKTPLTKEELKAHFHTFEAAEAAHAEATKSAEALKASADRDLEKVVASLLDAGCTDTYAYKGRTFKFIKRVNEDGSTNYHVRERKPPTTVKV